MFTTMIFLFEASIEGAKECLAMMNDDEPTITIWSKLMHTISSWRFLFSLDFWIIRFKFILHIEIFRHTGLIKKTKLVDKCFNQKRDCFFCETEPEGPQSAICACNALTIGGHFPGRLNLSREILIFKKNFLRKRSRWISKDQSI